MCTHSRLFPLALALTVSCARAIAPIDPDASPDAAPDASPDASGDVPAQPACDAALPLGAVRWRTSLSHDIYVWGPMASDAEGNTYFVHDSTLLGIRPDPDAALISLDPCGNVRWRVPWNHLDTHSVEEFAVVVGSHVVVVNADVQSFDRATGAHEWTVIPSRTRDADSMRAIAADRAGNAYLLLQSQGTIEIVRIDVEHGGGAATFVHIDGVSNASTATDLVLDPQGNLVFPVTDTNINPGPGVVHSYTVDGAMRYATHVATVDYQDHLTVGSSAIFNGDKGTVLSLDGSIARELNLVFGGAGVVDADDAVYLFDGITSGAVTFTSFDRNGARRWSTMLAGSYAFSYGGGPYLGQRSSFYVFDHVFVEADGGVGITQAVAVVDRGTGAIQTFEFPGRGSGHAALTDRGLVFLVEGTATAISSGDETLDESAIWSTPRGGPEQHGAPRGR